MDVVEFLIIVMLVWLQTSCGKKGQEVASHGSFPRKVIIWYINKYFKIFT